jgi:hypothetical protein
MAGTLVNCLEVIDFTSTRFLEAQMRESVVGSRTLRVLPALSVTSTSR